MKHYSIKVSGRVQGVMFRDSARRRGRKLGVNGFVQNQPDGTVSIEAEGEEKLLEAFLEWCRRGPPFARVDKLEVKEGSVVYYGKFEIRY